jgi:hypothetical protein
LSIRNYPQPKTFSWYRLYDTYPTYPCSQIIQAVAASATVVKHFDDLMAKSGNVFTNAAAYGGERPKALANQHVTEQAMKRKGCSSEPTKIDNKPEAHHQ